MIYKINFKSHFKALLSIITICFFIMIFLFYLYNNYYDFILLSKSIILIFLFLLVQVLIIHFQYYEINKNIILIKNGDNIQISINKIEFKIISYLDIIQINFFLSNTTFHNWNYQNLPFGDYHYCKIFLKTGETYIITSLLVPDLYEEFKTLPVKQICEIGFYNTIK